MSRETNSKKKICMIVPNKMVMGGIAAVVNGYPGSALEERYDITYVETYCDGGKLKKLFKAIKGYFHYIYVLLYDTPDLVHIHSSFGPSFYRKMPFIDMAERAGIPIVNHIHGAEFDAFFENASPKKKALIKKTYSKCSRLIALSDEWRERLSQIVDKDRIDIIPNYSKIMVSENEVSELVSKRYAKPYVLFLGELGKRKGCFDMPEIAKKVWEKAPEISFVLGGKGSDFDEADIKMAFEKSGAAILKHYEESADAKTNKPKVYFPGWVRDDIKDSLLRNALIFILPSYNEGLPMSILDAMGYALPIVSTEVGGISKIVKNDINGFCLKPGDTKAMADAIIALCKDQDMCLKYSENSLDIIKKGFSLDSHIDLLCETYEKA